MVRLLGAQPKKPSVVTGRQVKGHEGKIGQLLMGRGG